MSDPLAPPDVGSIVFVEQRADLERMAAELAPAKRIALDTEANGMHAYRERTCLAQVTAGKTTYLVDVIAVQDLSPLARACDRPDLEIVLHGGDYDISMLTRDHGFRFHRVFDTMIAAMVLGEEKLGLAALVERHFGVTLDKKFQTTDWSRRPLAPAQIEYLYRDTIYLEPLRTLYGERLRDADLVEEAEIEFARLATRQGQPVTFDPEGWRRIKGSKDLDARGRAVLAELHLWREEEAAARDRPPFKVVSPQALLRIALEVKQGTPRGDPARGLSGRERRYAVPVRAAVARGLERHARGEAPEKTERTQATRLEREVWDATRRREDALRAWRRKEAAARKVPNLVVLPNPALEWIAREMPADLETLALSADIGPKRVDRYGEAILEALRRAATEPESR